MPNGKLKLKNGFFADSVRAISTTISLGKLFKEDVAILLFFLTHCRSGNPQLDPTQISVEYLHELKLCDENGLVDEDVMNVTVCTVRGELIESLDLISPAAG